MAVWHYKQSVQCHWQTWNYFLFRHSLIHRPQFLWKWKALLYCFVHRKLSGKFLFLSRLLWSDLYKYFWLQVTLSINLDQNLHSEKNVFSVVKTQFVLYWPELCSYSILIKFPKDICKNILRSFRTWLVTVIIPCSSHLVAFSFLWFIISTGTCHSYDIFQ